MKGKMMIFSLTVLLSVAGLGYGLTSFQRGCPLEGTPFCPKTNCPLAGTPNCPFEAESIAQLPACCMKK